MSMSDEDRERLLGSLESALMPDRAAEMFARNLQEGQEARLRDEFHLSYDIRPLITRQDDTAFREPGAPGPSSMEDLGYAMAKALGEALRVPPKLLTPLPRHTRIRLAYTGFLSRVAAWCCVHGMITVALVLWWLADRPAALIRAWRRWNR